MARGGFSDLLRSLGDDGADKPTLAPDIEAIRLRDSLAALNVRHEFKPGMIVRQKPQAKLYRDYGWDAGMGFLALHPASDVRVLQRD
jgi:hypothetical protein